MESHKTVPLAEQSAFPIPGMNMQGLGMSLRDYFAAKAMQSLISVYMSESRHVTNTNIDYLTRDSYSIADGMIKSRSE